MNRVAIYCRLSDEDMDKINCLEESESIQNQKNLLTRYSIEKGWEIYKIYCDENYSGLDKDRPDFNRMICDAEAGRFSIILCKHQSRFTRDMELVEKYLHNKFIEWGIRFVTVVDGVDTADKNNKKSRQIGGLVNEWYSEDTSESIKTVVHLKQMQGKFIGPFASYGYTKNPYDKNSLIIDEEAAEIVKKIYRMYLSGNGVKHIADILNQECVPNPTMYKKLKGLKFVNSSAKDNNSYWTDMTVRRILKNEMYIGNMVQHITQKISYKHKKRICLPKRDWIIISNTHQAIIDKSEFEKVQSLFQRRTRSTTSGKVHLFAGKVRCFDCGSMMKKTSNNEKQYLYCGACRKSMKYKQCTRHSIRLDDLEMVVEGRIRYYILSIDEDSIVAKIMQQNYADKKNKLFKQRLILLNEIQNRETALKNLYLDKVTCLISESQFIRYNTSFKDEIEQKSKRLSDIEKEINKVNVESNSLEYHKKLVKKYKSFEKINRGMINEMIDYIEIGEKDKNTLEQVIIIHWLF